MTKLKKLFLWGNKKNYQLLAHISKKPDVMSKNCFGFATWGVIPNEKILRCVEFLSVWSLPTLFLPTLNISGTDRLFLMSVLVGRNRGDVGGGGGGRVVDTSSPEGSSSSSELC